MIKKISQMLFAIMMVLMCVSCKNTKQKLQEYVTTYNSTTAKSFKSENITLTTARGYINDNKIELRFETDLPQNDSNKTTAEKKFPALLKKMINKNEIPKELIEEGVQFDAYFLADDNTVLMKQVMNKDEMIEILK